MNVQLNVEDLDAMPDAFANRVLAFYFVRSRRRLGSKAGDGHSDAGV